MNIKTAIDNINEATDNAREKILSAYDHLEAKGAIIPTDKNLTNLNACIDSIPFEGVYGVVIDTASSAYRLQRVGNMNLHKSLPVQSLMRRCLLLDDGTVNYYLDANDSNLKEDGTPALLDGTDGQVMVEIPLHYRGLRTIDDTHYRVDISLYPFIGAVEVPKMYVSAFEAALYHKETSGRLLCSVVNDSADYRGGALSRCTSSQYDDTSKSMLGMPITGISYDDVYHSAIERGAGWCCYEYRAHLALYWLFTIEYATLHSQGAFNAEKTVEGFAQGGLGHGLTAFTSESWNQYNNYNPLCPCGVTVGLGNNSGEVVLPITREQMDMVYESETSAKACSYRGVENVFGHIHKMVAGLFGRSLAIPGVDIFNNANDYGDYHKGTYVTELPKTSGYIHKIYAGVRADIFPVEVGEQHARFCDRFFAQEKLYRYAAFGGCSSNGSYSGMSAMTMSGRMDSSETQSNTHGTRLCYCSEPNCFKLVE